MTTVNDRMFGRKVAIKVRAGFMTSKEQIERAVHDGVLKVRHTIRDSCPTCASCGKLRMETVQEISFDGWHVGATCGAKKTMIVERDAPEAYWGEEDSSKVATERVIGPVAQCPDGAHALMAPAGSSGMPAPKTPEKIRGIRADKIWVDELADLERAQKRVIRDPASIPAAGWPPPKPAKPRPRDEPRTVCDDAW